MKARKEAGKTEHDRLIFKIGGSLEKRGSFMKFTIRKKLLSGFALVLGLLFITSALSITRMDSMGRNSVEIDSVWVPSLVKLSEINGHVSEINGLVLKYVLETSKFDMKNIEKELKSTMLDVQDDVTSYKKYISSKEEQAAYDSFTKSFNYYLEKLPPILDAGWNNNYEKANELQKSAGNHYETAKSDISRLVEINEKGANKVVTGSVDTYHSARVLVLAIALAALAAGAVIALYISQIISKPLIAISGAAKQISEGNLTSEDVKVKNNDEIGELSASFNHMAQNLRILIKQVGSSAEQVAASAEELTASAEQTGKATEQIAHTVQGVALGAQHQVDSVNSSIDIMNGMAAGIKQIAANTANVSDSAGHTLVLADGGNGSIKGAVEQMESLHLSIQSLNMVVGGLGARAQEIGTIVEVITNIAGQTNLLALNAAIEAARAGEQGKGFAVVADEVRKLAEQSSRSAMQITDLVKAIQSETMEAVETMKRSTVQVDEGIGKVKDSGEVFSKILAAVHEVTGQIQEVSAASRQMSAGVIEVVASVEQISGLAESAAAGTQEASAATEEQLASMEEISSSASALARMSEELQELIGKFKV